MSYIAVLQPTSFNTFTLKTPPISLHIWANPWHDVTKELGKNAR